MRHSILASAAASGRPVTLKMFDNTTVRGTITALDEDGLLVIDATRIINAAQVREVHVTDEAMSQILADSRSLAYLTRD